MATQNQPKMYGLLWLAGCLAALWGCVDSGHEAEFGLGTASLEAGASVASFTLVNADTYADIRILRDGDVINLARVGTRLSIRANPGSDKIRSVRFEYDGQRNYQTENVVPYALNGDQGGRYRSWTPTLGSHTLLATAYSKRNAGGIASSPSSLRFTVRSGTTDDRNGDGLVTISGARNRWHKITLTLDGPWANETMTPNPFTNYRMDVTFTRKGLTYVVPGYFAADGDAANTGAEAGTKWRAHLAPDRIGNWTYTIRFTEGGGVAFKGGGSPVAPFDGITGMFRVFESEKSGRDNRAKGRLTYVGAHYLQYAGSKEYFLKQGADAPENFLAYADFDGDFKRDGIKDHLVKTWGAHIEHWKKGDSTWQEDKGQGIIGAINYLADKGMNALSFLTMNIDGDDRNVFPYRRYNTRRRMDVSRLAQWEIVFEHADRMGMYLHFKTQEQENDQLLDGGALGPRRKLYYRELIARFSHHLAMNWNLGEENTNTESQQKTFAQFFYDNDPYRHNVVLHTFPRKKNQVYTPLLGDASKLTGASVQSRKPSFLDVHDDVRTWVARSASAGKPWVVASDESGGAFHGVIPDDEDPSHDSARKEGLWGTLMAGGAGNEWYFGYGHAHSDLTCEDFQSRDLWWDQCGVALDFFHKNEIPFWEMRNDNDKSSATDDYCFYKDTEIYVVYLKNGGTTDLDLTGVSGAFRVRWYDPMTGGALLRGTKLSVLGGRLRSLGHPPYAGGADWVILIRRKST